MPGLLSNRRLDVNHYDILQNPDINADREIDTTDQLCCEETVTRASLLSMGG